MNELEQIDSVTDVRDTVDIRAYVASALSEVLTARSIARGLEAAGIGTTSTWADVVEDGDVDPTAHRDRSSILAQNLADLTRADVVVLWVATGTPRCAFVEAGFALALGKPIVLIHGPNREGTCLVDGHANVTAISSTSDVVEAVRRAVGRQS